MSSSLTSSLPFGLIFQKFSLLSTSRTRSFGNGMLRGFIQQSRLMSYDIFVANCQVQKVPNHFGCIEEYINVYSKHLIEECRANLESSLRNISSSPYYCVETVLHTDSHSVYFIDIDLRDLVLNAKHTNHMAEEGDIFLFSSHSPQDSNFNYSLTYFGMVIDTSQYTKFHKGFKALMSKNCCTEYLPGNTKFAIFLTNVKDSVSVWNALSFDNTEENCSAINSILKLAEMVRLMLTVVCVIAYLDLKIESNNLNQDQTDCLKSVAAAIQCKHRNFVKLFWGPPGSGKTQIITTMLSVLHDLDFKVLLCVPRKDDIVQLLMNLEVCLYPLVDILVLDSLAASPLARKFDQACLDHRSQDFLTCMLLFKQWVAKMIILLELKNYCTKNCDHQTEQTRCSTTDLPIFKLHSFKHSFNVLVKDLQKCLMDLRDKFSAMCLSDNSVNDVTNLLDMLKKFKGLLCHEGIHDRNIQRIFGLLSSTQLASRYSGCSIEEELNDARMALLEFLQTFRSSIALPKFDNRKSVEDYCIAHSKVIICTAPASFRLHEANMESINLLIVDDADQIKECSLIIPLRLPLSHILMFGDNCNFQPVVKSKVCEETGFATSLFERLLNLGFPNHLLKEQHVIHPSVFQFPNKHFYDGRIINSPNVVSPEYNEQFKDLVFSNYCFIDVTNTNGSAPMDKDSVEAATILYMPKIFYECWKDIDQTLEIGVMSLCSSRVNAMKGLLKNKYATHNRINVHVKCADNFQGEMYHVVILSTLFKDDKKLLQSKNINAALTSARHCLRVLGEAFDPFVCGGVWEKLIDDAIERKCFVKLNPETLPVVIDHSRNTHGLSDLLGSNSASSKVSKEFTWDGRPHRTKYILAPLRDQKTSDTCTFHACLGAMESLYKFQYACMEPPNDFSWILSTDDLTEQYKAVTTQEIGYEDIMKRGYNRLETVLEILKERGIIGSKSLQPEVTSRFRIKSYSRLTFRRSEDLDKALSTVKDGSILVAHFRISRNYFSLRPGEIYHYDCNNPCIRPTSCLPVAHVVMIVGSGDALTKLPNGEIQYDLHLNLQNSAGRLFGDNGFGKIGGTFVRGLYRMEI